jgi:hypothetical protein
MKGGYSERVENVFLPLLTSNKRRCKINVMTRTQIQLPDALYRRAKAMAAAREISLAELVRNGLEYMLRVSAGAETDAAAWALPEPAALGGSDPFADPDWRMRLHSREVAEEGSPSVPARKQESDR